MGAYTVFLRYYVGDPLEDISRQELDRIGKKYGVEISFERIDDRLTERGMKREETLGKAIEEITQDVIAVESDDEVSFRKAIAEVYERYRSPRTPYGFWGSSEEGARIAKGIADETGGGWT